MNDIIKIIKEITEIELNAVMDKMIIPIKIDISTGDIITPKEIEYTYKLMLEDRFINLYTYNLETVLAEKLQTIIVRSIYNTRMRDFYDIYALTKIYKSKINPIIFKEAFYTTSMKRNSTIDIETISLEINTIATNKDIQKLWNSYQKKYNYASYIDFNNTILSLNTLKEMLV